MTTLADNFRCVASAISDRLNRVNISPDDVRDALRRPTSFGYGGDRPMFETWSLGPVILHRDSGLLDQSNSDMLRRYLDESYPGTEGESWEITSCNHWAVGWVDHLSFHAVDDNGDPAPMFRVVKSWFDALSDYPVACGSDYSEREYEATCANYLSEGYGDRELKPGVDDDSWPYDVYSWFSDNDRHECIESTDDQGGYASSETIIEALEALGYLQPEDNEP